MTLPPAVPTTVGQPSNTLHFLKNMPNSLSKDYSDSDSKTAVRICPFDSLRVASLIREKKKNQTGKTCTSPFFLPAAASSYSCSSRTVCEAMQPTFTLKNDPF